MEQDEEPWVQPVWPRYLGVGWLVLCVIGFVAIGFVALTDDTVPDAAVILAPLGVYYVIPQLRTAWAKLREAKEQQ